MTWNDTPYHPHQCGGTPQTTKSYCRKLPLVRAHPWLFSSFQGSWKLCSFSWTIKSSLTLGAGLSCILLSCAWLVTTDRGRNKTWIWARVLQLRLHGCHFISFFHISIFLFVKANKRREERQWRGRGAREQSYRGWRCPTAHACHWTRNQWEGGQNWLLWNISTREPLLV